MKEFKRKVREKSFEAAAIVLARQAAENEAMLLFSQPENLICIYGEKEANERLASNRQNQATP
jgi:hypothetical protein